MLGLLGFAGTGSGGEVAPSSKVMTSGFMAIPLFF